MGYAQNDILNLGGAGDASAPRKRGNMTRRVRTTFGLGFLGLTLLTGDTVRAAGFPSPAKCAAGKQTAAGQEAFSLLKCYAKALLKALKGGGPIDLDPICVAKANAKFTASFGKLEAALGCVPVNNAAQVGATVDAAVTTLVGMLQGTTPPCAFQAPNDPCGAGGSCSLACDGTQGTAMVCTNLAAVGNSCYLSTDCPLGSVCVAVADQVCGPVHPPTNCVPVQLN